MLLYSLKVSVSGFVCLRLYRGRAVETCTRSLHHDYTLRTLKLHRYFATPTKNSQPNLITFLQLLEISFVLSNFFTDFYINKN